MKRNKIIPLYSYPTTETISNINVNINQLFVIEYIHIISDIWDDGKKWSGVYRDSGITSQYLILNSFSKENNLESLYGRAIHCISERDIEKYSKLTYNHKCSMSKDSFIILTDPVITRKHTVVEYQNRKFLLVSYQTSK